MTEDGVERDDALVSRVAQAFAETEPSPTPELERLVLGELAAKEAEVLRRQVSEQLFESHQPLGGAAQERIASRLMEAPLREAPAPPAAAPPSLGKRAAKHARMAWFGLPTIAAAALFALWLTQPETRSLGRYVLEAGPVSSTDRSAPAGAEAELRPRPGQPFRLVLRPEEPDTESIEAAVFVRGPGAPLEPVPAQVDRSASGALQVRLAWPSAPLRGELVVVVGRPGEPWLERVAEESSAGERWQRFTLRFRQ